MFTMIELDGRMLIELVQLDDSTAEMRILTPYSDGGTFIRFPLAGRI